MEEALIHGSTSTLVPSPPRKNLYYSGRCRAHKDVANGSDRHCNEPIINYRNMVIVTYKVITNTYIFLIMLCMSPSRAAYLP